ncbi:MAG: murein transglycosylase A [Syntrophales bacterium]
MAKIKTSKQFSDLKFRPCRDFIPFFFIAILLLLAGCAIKVEKPTPIPPAPPVLLELISEEYLPFFDDDLDQASLELAVERSLQYYDRKTNSLYRYGNEQYTSLELKESLLSFLDIVRSPGAYEHKRQKIRDTFDVYRAVGFDNNEPVIITGYYEPILEGSLERTERYRYPIYRTPDDTVVVKLGKFSKKYGNDRIVGRLQNGEVIPHYTRAEIDGTDVLKDRSLEIVWVDDPVALFSLHTQGSGKIRLPDGGIIQVGYAQSNGHPFRSVARFLLSQGRISKGELSHRSVKRYLSEQHPDELSEILNHNESYIFFRILENGPLGGLGFPLTAGRTIAADPKVFPRGALAFIRSRKPLLNNGNIVEWQSFSRFVLFQDTGGIITGPKSLDLYCGTGNDAEVLAGSLKEKSELYFLVKKRDNVQ